MRGGTGTSKTWHTLEQAGTATSIDEGENPENFGIKNPDSNTRRFHVTDGLRLSLGWFHGFINARNAKLQDSVRFLRQQIRLGCGSTLERPCIDS